MLKFSSVKFVNLVKKECYLLVERLVDEYRERVMSDVQMQDIPSALKKHAEVESDVVVIKEHILGLVEANAIVLAASYGMGSKMESQRVNPFLKEYKNSSEWNKARKSTNAIAGREEGTYTTIFGNTRKTKGSMAGKNLEKTYKPFKGSLIIPKALDEMEIKLRIEMVELLKRIDFSICIS